MQQIWGYIPTSSKKWYLVSSLGQLGSSIQSCRLGPCAYKWVRAGSCRMRCSEDWSWNGLGNHNSMISKVTWLWASGEVIITEFGAAQPRWVSAPSPNKLDDVRMRVLWHQTCSVKEWKWVWYWTQLKEVKVARQRYAWRLLWTYREHKTAHPRLKDESEGFRLWFLLQERCKWLYSRLQKSIIVPSNHCDA
jgi:hypothetical protein